jgi:hypothetical protein
MAGGLTAAVSGLFLGWLSSGIRCRGPRTNPEDTPGNWHLFLIIFVQAVAVRPIVQLISQAALKRRLPSYSLHALTRKYLLPYYPGTAFDLSQME